MHTLVVSSSGSAVNSASGRRRVDLIVVSPTVVSVACEGTNVRCGDSRRLLVEAPPDYDYDGREIGRDRRRAKE